MLFIGPESDPSWGARLVRLSSTFEVTIHALLVPRVPGKFTFSLPWTLEKPVSILTGEPFDKGPLTHHMVYMVGIFDPDPRVPGMPDMPIPPVDEADT